MIHQDTTTLGPHWGPFFMVQYWGNQPPSTMAKGPTTVVSNAKLDHLLKLADTYCIKAENGEWDVEPGTYKAIKNAVDHVKMEQFKQARQRRRTMNIDFVADEERRPNVSRLNTQEMDKP